MPRSSQKQASTTSAARKGREATDQGELPHYAVERGLFNAAARDIGKSCPVCGRDGKWDGDVFVPLNERQGAAPRCYCATIHKAGGYAYDPVSHKILMRGEG
jgi:hypothetical protein